MAIGNGRRIARDNKDEASKYHDRLLHREYPGQHPIKAINGLSQKLSSKMVPGDVISNAEIDAILKK